MGDNGEFWESRPREEGESSEEEDDTQEYLFGVDVTAARGDSSDEDSHGEQNARHKSLYDLGIRSVPGKRPETKRVEATSMSIPAAFLGSTKSPFAGSQEQVEAGRSTSTEQAEKMERKERKRKRKAEKAQRREEKRRRKMAKQNSASNVALSSSQDGEDLLQSSTDSAHVRKKDRERRKKDKKKKKERKAKKEKQDEDRLRNDPNAGEGVSPMQIDSSAHANVVSAGAHPFEKLQYDGDASKAKSAIPTNSLKPSRPVFQKANPLQTGRCVVIGGFVHVGSEWQICGRDSTDALLGEVLEAVSVDMKKKGLLLISCAMHP